VLRLPGRTIDFVTRHAHPLIRFVDGPSGYRASLKGSGLDVWAVVATVRDNDGSVEEAAGYLQIPDQLVQAAFAFYAEHRDEIDADIDLNEAEYRRGFEAASADQRSAHR
jgi:hypothetical protein